jgi:hypothetical protein
MSTLGAPFAETPIEKDADFHTAKAKLLERFERSYLEQLLSHHQGNLSAASRASGLVRHHLRALLKKHGIDAPPMEGEVKTQLSIHRRFLVETSGVYVRMLRTLHTSPTAVCRCCQRLLQPIRSVRFDLPGLPSDFRA